MKMLKKFIASSLGVAVLLSQGSAVLAESFSGNFGGLPAMTMEIVNGPIEVYEDFSFEVSTNDGSDISAALSDYELGFSRITDSGVELGYSLENVLDDVYSVEDLGDTLRVTIDVTGEGEQSAEVQGGFPPIIRLLSLEFDADQEHTLEFGVYDGASNTVDAFMSVDLEIVPSPVELAVFPEGEVDEGQQMFFVVMDANGEATSLPGDHYMAVFDTDALVNVGTTLDGKITEDAVVDGLYYFTAPEAGNYRVTMGPAAFVPRVDSYEFSVAGAAAGFDYIDNFNWSAFDFSNVDLGQVQLPEGLWTPTDIALSNLEPTIGKSVIITMTKEVNGEDVELALPEGWDLQVWRAAGIAGPAAKVLSYADGGVTFSDGGNYKFMVPDLAVGYSVRLVSADGDVVSEVNFVAQADEAAQVDNDLAGNVNLADLIFDPSDLVIDPDFLDGVVVENDEGNEVMVCADMDESYWGYEVVNNLLSEGLFPVITDAVSVNCRPNTAVTRKEFTVWLLQAYRAEAVADIQDFHEAYDYNDSPFTDITGDDPYDPYIIMANQFGIVSGNPDGTFRPDNTINRAEVLKILLRSSEIFLATDAEVEALDPADNPVDKFVDEDDEDWYTPYLQYAVGAEIIEGRTVNGVRVSAMSDGVLFGEAAKILYLARLLGN